jgi:cbb3-type cytochrome oxidase cytochrome c subunit
MRQWTCQTGNTLTNGKETKMLITREGPVTLDEAKAIIVARGYTVLDEATGEDDVTVHAYSVERIAGSSVYGPPACMVCHAKGTKNTAIHI